MKRLEIRNAAWRRRVLFGVLALTLSSPEVTAQTKVRVGKAQAQSFTLLLADVGRQAGIFKKHDLDLEISSYGGDAKLTQALIGGSVDIALAAGTTFSFIAKGTPMKGIVAIAGPPSTIMLVVARDGAIKTEVDLKGRTVSFSNNGSLSHWLGLELVRLNGWPPGTLKWAPLGAPAGQIAALKTRQIDGVITESSTIFRAEEEGAARVLVRFGDRIPDFIVSAMFASNAMIEKQPETVRKFVAAWFETVRFMREKKSETIDIIVNEVTMPRSVAVRNYDLLMPIFSQSGRFEEKALDVLARSFVELAILPGRPELKPMLTDAFLPR